MAMARHDSCQYPQHVRQHAGLVRFGQMNVSQMSVGQLGKRKRPGSGSSLASTSAVAQGHYHDSLTQRGTDMKTQLRGRSGYNDDGAEASSAIHVSLEETTPVRISISKPNVPSPSTTASDTLAIGSSSRSSITATVCTNPFRSTEGPSSPKSRRKLVSATTAVTHTSPTRMRDFATAATATTTSLSLAASRQNLIDKHDVKDASYISVISEAYAPTARVNLSEPLLQISSLERLPLLPAPFSVPSQEQQNSKISSPHASVPIAIPLSMSRLEPCHICHNRPRQKSDLVKYVDCGRCANRVCCVCVRECSGAKCRARLMCSGCCVESTGDDDADGNEGDGGGSGNGDGNGDKRGMNRGNGVFCLDCLDGE